MDKAAHSCRFPDSSCPVWHTEEEALQVRAKYYRVVKSLVDYLGSSMPPKPHTQAALQALMLQHWDRVRLARIAAKFFCHCSTPISATYPCTEQHGRPAKGLQQVSLVAGLMHIILVPADCIPKQEEWAAASVHGGEPPSSCSTAAAGGSLQA